MSQEKINQQDQKVEQAVAEGGAYELIARRLSDQGKELTLQIESLNQRRIEEFGHTDLEVAGRVRVRTENNCVPRDIIRVGKHILFAYNVHMGLKNEVQVHDVFNLYKIEENEQGFEINEIPQANTFLTDINFQQQFKELYKYYKSTTLTQLYREKNRFYAVFKIGRNINDIRVFRWKIDNHGHVSYIDDRGEREISQLKPYDFEWQGVTRDDHVNGRFAHINILDTVFVETTKGDLTIKIENNTSTGEGIYSEPVEERNQSLSDIELYYAQLDGLILIKIKPYRENDFRYLVYNTRNQEVKRIDALGNSCIQLLEDHGIVYPGGYYLQTGESKSFGEEAEGLTFQRLIKSPNGEDALYVFYAPKEGRIGLLAYNLVHKKLQNPIYCHGMARFDDGRFLLFEFESNSEPTRIHPMQIWKTPFYSDEFAAHKESSQSFLGKLGNAEIVRGISELFSLARNIYQQTPGITNYESIIKTCGQILDSYYWLTDKEAGHFAAQLKEIASTSELVLDEFEKVQAIQAQANEAIKEAQIRQRKLLKELNYREWKTPMDFVEALRQLRHQSGHLLTIKDYRYIDLEQIEILRNDIEQGQDKISVQTVAFLSQPNALAFYTGHLQNIEEQVVQVDSVAKIKPLLEDLTTVTQGLDLLTELLGSLNVDEATTRTEILETISEVYAQANQIKASAGHKKKSLGSKEAIAEFSAQFKLFAQSVNNALNLLETPEDCDDQLSRLMVQLEELESRFSDFDEFLGDILSKREEVQEVFESRRQQLQDKRNRRSQNLYKAAKRILDSITRRTSSYQEQDEINTYFASDPMPHKVIEIAEELKHLGDSVKSDEIEALLKTTKQQALRGLRDKQEIYTEGGNVIKLGQYHFSVNTQSIDITLLPDNETKTPRMLMHIMGTDFTHAIKNEQLLDMHDYWEQSLVSETKQVFRSEYLAWCFYKSVESGKHSTVKMDQLLAARNDDQQLLEMLREYAQPRYQEGYEKGIHDHDGSKILMALLNLQQQAGLLRFSPSVRGLAMLYWFQQDTQQQQQWLERSRNARSLYQLFGSIDAILQTTSTMQTIMNAFIRQQQITVEASQLAQSARYLVEALAGENTEFLITQEADLLVSGLRKFLQHKHMENQLVQLLNSDKHALSERMDTARAWLLAYCEHQNKPELIRFIAEAIAILFVSKKLKIKAVSITLVQSIEGLMGEHPLIHSQKINFILDDFIERLTFHSDKVVDGFKQYHQLRQELIEAQRKQLNLEQFMAKPISSFIRNRLINEVYLPIIGANLAKQMGTVGENKRTDLMGLLLLISPPGYGKTTLMEYIANRLGLIFMKINCPSIGHQVESLDSQEAHHATARQELIKLNFALEMGNNVMLYLDDIQHTNPEFLQKFISLCDASRRIEGVWEEETKTYDMRGKKFCVVMAGNPYTESGEAFKIPDMLANRADIYNLGDILGGAQEAFESSYIENTLTSNPVLAPLANRDLQDLYLLMRMAKGENIPGTDLKYNYSAVEINEIVELLKRLFKAQKVVLKVNQQYIASAAQADKYRTEPPFRLQGSYRNMNKMAEKVNPIMNDKELQQMIHEHYIGEAQTLTSGAEENLLKLDELRGVMTKESQMRWTKMKKEFVRINSLGGDDADATSQLANQIGVIATRLSDIQESVSGETMLSQNVNQLNQSVQAIQQVMDNACMEVNVTNEPVTGVNDMFNRMAGLFETSFLPVFQAMNHKLALDMSIWKDVQKLTEEINQLGDNFKQAKSQTQRTRKRMTKHVENKPAEKPKGWKDIQAKVDIKMGQSIESSVEHKPVDKS